MVGNGVRVMVAVAPGVGVKVPMTAVALGNGVSVCRLVAEGWSGISRIVVALQAVRNKTIRDDARLRTMDFSRYCKGFGIVAIDLICSCGDKPGKPL